MIIDVPTRCPLCNEPVHWSMCRNRYECHTKNEDNSLHFICRYSSGNRDKKIKNNKIFHQIIIGKYLVYLGENQQIAILDRSKYDQQVMKSKMPTGFNLKLIDTQEKISDFIQDYEILK